MHAEAVAGCERVGFSDHFVLERGGDRTVPAEAQVRAGNASPGAGPADRSARIGGDGLIGLHAGQDPPEVGVGVVRADHLLQEGQLTADTRTEVQPQHPEPVRVTHRQPHRADGVRVLRCRRAGVRRGQDAAGTEGRHVADVVKQVRDGVGDTADRHATQAVPDQHHRAVPCGLPHDARDARLVVVEAEAFQGGGLDRHRCEVLPLVRLRHESLRAVPRLVHHDDAVAAQHQFPRNRHPERAGAVGTVHQHVRCDTATRVRRGRRVSEPGGQRHSSHRESQPAQRRPPGGTFSFLVRVIRHEHNAMNGPFGPPSVQHPHRGGPGTTTLPCGSQGPTKSTTSTQTESSGPSTGSNSPAEQALSCRPDATAILSRWHPYVTIGPMTRWIECGEVLAADASEATLAEAGATTPIPPCGKCQERRRPCPPTWAFSTWP